MRINISREQLLAFHYTTNRNYFQLTYAFATFELISHETFIFLSISEGSMASVIIHHPIMPEETYRGTVRTAVKCRTCSAPTYRYSLHRYFQTRPSQGISSDSQHVTFGKWHSWCVSQFVVRSNKPKIEVNF